MKFNLNASNYTVNKVSMILKFLMEVYMVIMYCWLLKNYYWLFETKSLPMYKRIFKFIIYSSLGLLDFIRCCSILASFWLDRSNSMKNFDAQINYL